MLAALEPHFAARLCAAAGIDAVGHALLTPDVHAAIARWLRGKTRQTLDLLAADKDIPLLTLPA